MAETTAPGGRSYPEDYCPCEAYPDCVKRGEDFCYIHHRHEQSVGPTYRVCFECGHVYYTEEELLDEEWHANGGDVERLTCADGIYFCPLCLHDW